MRETDDRIRAELETIRRSDPNRKLYPEATIEFARDPVTALHKRFEWDDTKAGHEYRLEQARRLIRVHITVLDRGDGKTIPIRAYLCLQDNGEQGYFQTKVVLSNKSKRKQLIAMLLHRLASIIDLHSIPELDEIRRAIVRTRDRYGIAASRREEEAETLEAAE